MITRESLNKLGKASVEEHLAEEFADVHFKYLKPWPPGQSIWVLDSDGSYIREDQHASILREEQGRSFEAGCSFMLDLLFPGVEALGVAANQLEGVALAIQAHGTSINPVFFIESYTKFSATAREFLAKLERELEWKNGY